MIEEWDDESIMPFGYHRGKPLGGIPDDYFKTLEYMNSGETEYRKLYPGLFIYIEENIL